MLKPLPQWPQIPISGSDPLTQSYAEYLQALDKFARALRQPLVLGGAGFSLSAGAAFFLGASAANGNESVVAIPVISASSFDVMQVATSGSPGGGQSFTFTVRKNFADTAMVATISGGVTSASVTLATPVQFAAGDLIALHAVASGGATNTGSVWASLGSVPS